MGQSLTPRFRLLAAYAPGIDGVAKPVPAVSGRDGTPGKPGPAPLRRGEVPGIGFFKLCPSGHGPPQVGYDDGPAYDEPHAAGFAELGLGDALQIGRASCRARV